VTRGRILVAAVAVCIAGGGAYGALAATATSSVSTAKVTMKEWATKPVPPSVPKGKVTFSFRNIGKLNHELIILKTNVAAGKLPVKNAKAVLVGKVEGKIGQIKPGRSAKITLTLPKGKYVLLCNLPAHYQAGQHAAFKVT
jgi:uncharacterized cupredoxin-like copper-binding protein